MILDVIAKSIDIVAKTYKDEDNLTKNMQPETAYLVGKKDGSGEHERYVTDKNKNISKASGGNQGGAGPVNQDLLSRLGTQPDKPITGKYKVETTMIGNVPLFYPQKIEVSGTTYAYTLIGTGVKNDSDELVSIVAHSYINNNGASTNTVAMLLQTDNNIGATALALYNITNGGEGPGYVPYGTNTAVPIGNGAFGLYGYGNYEIDLGFIGQSDYRDHYVPNSFVQKAWVEETIAAAGGPSTEQLWSLAPADIYEEMVLQIIPWFLWDEPMYISSILLDYYNVSSISELGGYFSDQYGPEVGTLFLTGNPTGLNQGNQIRYLANFLVYLYRYQTVGGTFATDASQIDQSPYYNIGNQYETDIEKYIYLFEVLNGQTWNDYFSDDYTNYATLGELIESTGDTVPKILKPNFGEKQNPWDQEPTWPIRVPKNYGAQKPNDLLTLGQAIEMQKVYKGSQNIRLNDDTYDSGYPMRIELKLPPIATHELITLTGNGQSVGEFVKDSQGNIFFILEGNILKKAPDNTITNFTSTNSQFTSQIYIDGSDNIYWLNGDQKYINKCTPAGVRTTFISGLPDYPVELIVNTDGSMYVFCNIDKKILFISDAGVSEELVTLPSGRIQRMTKDSNGNLIMQWYKTVLQVSTKGFYKLDPVTKTLTDLNASPIDMYGPFVLDGEDRIIMATGINNPQQNYNASRITILTPDAQFVEHIKSVTEAPLYSINSILLTQYLGKERLIITSSLSTGNNQGYEGIDLPEYVFLSLDLKTKDLEIIYESMRLEDGSGKNGYHRLVVDDTGTLWTAHGGNDDGDLVKIIPVKGRTLSIGGLKRLEFTNPTSYSLEETKTGGTWIDGKPIYRKVIEGILGTLGEASVEFIGMDEIDVVISKFIYTRGNDGLSAIEFAEDGFTHLAVRYDNINQSFNIISNTDKAGNTYYLTVEYTKTTD